MGINLLPAGAIDSGLPRGPSMGRGGAKRTPGCLSKKEHGLQPVTAFVGQSVRIVS